MAHDDNMIHIICAACKSVIGTLDSAENLNQDADEIAIAHYESCSATPEEKEQAIIDIKFRELTEGLGL